MKIMKTIHRLSKLIRWCPWDTNTYARIKEVRKTMQYRKNRARAKTISYPEQCLHGLGRHWLLGNRQPEPLNLGVPVVCRHALLINVKPITAHEKFYFPRANAFLARAQTLLWVRDWVQDCTTRSSPALSL